MIYIPLYRNLRTIPPAEQHTPKTMQNQRHNVTFYPLGNADCCLIKMGSGPEWH